MKPRCFFRLHSYKIVIKLKQMENSYVGGNIDIIEVPFEAHEICRHCGIEKDHITGHIGAHVKDAAKFIKERMKK